MLRHEDRTQDCSFFAPLTKQGIENSHALIKTLANCNINKVYCSPFIRALQTVDPYIRETKSKINIEYGLEEINHEDIIAKKAAGVNLPEYLAEIFNYDPEYKSYIKPDQIIYPEKTCHVEKRIKRFLRHLITEQTNTDNTILLVTHQGACTSILKVIAKAKPEYKIDIDTEYMKGKLSLVYDNDWVYKPIN
jgi:broad specificity phosphatase PhoE